LPRKGHKKVDLDSQLLTEEDQAANVRVLREAKAATHHVFDPATKQLIEVPDHKTRLAAITLELAYTEGRPIERQMSLSGNFEDLATLFVLQWVTTLASLERADLSQSLPSPSHFP